MLAQLCMTPLASREESFKTVLRNYEQSGYNGTHVALKDLYERSASADQILTSLSAYADFTLASLNEIDWALLVLLCDRCERAPSTSLTAAVSSSASSLSLFYQRVEKLIVSKADFGVHANTKISAYCFLRSQNLNTIQLAGHIFDNILETKNSGALAVALSDPYASKTLLNGKSQEEKYACLIWAARIPNKTLAKIIMSHVFKANNVDEPEALRQSKLVGSIVKLIPGHEAPLLTKLSVYYFLRSQNLPTTPTVAQAMFPLITANNNADEWALLLSDASYSSTPFDLHQAINLLPQIISWAAKQLDNQAIHSLLTQLVRLQDVEVIEQLLDCCLQEKGNMLKLLHEALKTSEALGGNANFDLIFLDKKLAQFPSDGDEIITNALTALQTYSPEHQSELFEAFIGNALLKHVSNSYLLNKNNIDHLVSLSCQGQCTLKTLRNIFKIMPAPVEENSLSYLFFMRQKLSENPSNAKHIITQALLALNTLKSDCLELAIINGLFNTFIAPELKELPSYLPYAANEILRCNTTLLSDFARLTSTMTLNAENFEFLVTFTVELAAHWKLEDALIAEGVEEQEKKVTQFIDANFENHNTYKSERAECEAYIQNNTSVKQNGLWITRTEKVLKQEFIHNLKTARVKLIHADQVKNVVRNIVGALINLLATPNLWDEICRPDTPVLKNPNRERFSTALEAILKHDTSAFVRSISSLLWNQDTGEVLYTPETIHWLFNLNCMRNLEFIQPTDPQFSINGKIYLANLLKFNDPHVNAKLFTANQDLNDKPLYLGITKLENFEGLNSILNDLFLLFNLYVPDYYPTASEAFKQLPQVKTIMQLHYFFHPDLMPATENSALLDLKHDFDASIFCHYLLTYHLGDLRHMTEKLADVYFSECSSEQKKASPEYERARNLHLQIKKMPKHLRAQLNEKIEFATYSLAYRAITDETVTVTSNRNSIYSIASLATTGHSLAGKSLENPFLSYILFHLKTYYSCSAENAEYPSTPFIWSAYIESYVKEKRNLKGAEVSSEEIIYSEDKILKVNEWLSRILQNKKIKEIFASLPETTREEIFGFEGSQSKAELESISAKLQNARDSDSSDEDLRTPASAGEGVNKSKSRSIFAEITSSKETESKRKSWLSSPFGRKK